MIQTGGETYGQKVWRKVSLKPISLNELNDTPQLKEEPLIPAFAALTCLALVQASRKMSKGDQRSMNRWLRFRVIAQGATIAALLGYSYVYGFGKFAPVDVKHDDQERRRLHSEKERERFESRMKEVEEMHRAETSPGTPPTSQQKTMDGMLGTESTPSQLSSWLSKFGWGKKS
jgi:hypothetical protein